MMTQHSASEADRAFTDDFEQGAIAPADFHHEQHLRLAYVLLCENPPDQAYEHFQSALLAFLKHHDVNGSKYHATITRAWLLAVRHFMHQSGTTRSFQDFIARNLRLLDTSIMGSHYSKALLNSETARRKYVAPDLTPIPEHDVTES